MKKFKMTLLKITQNNVHIFTPLKVSKIIAKEISKKDISKKYALIYFSLHPLMHHQIFDTIHA